MTTTLTGSVTENPSQVDHTTGSGKKTRPEGSDRHKFNLIIREHYEKYGEEQEEGARFYCPGDEYQWKQAVNRRNAVLNILERERGDLEDMDNYFQFRCGFLAGMEYTESSSDRNEPKQAPPKRLDDIVKILTGTGHIPSVKQAFFDAMLNWGMARHREWGPFSFITSPAYKKAKERESRIGEELNAIPEEYQKIVGEYTDAVACTRCDDVEDGYWKGLVDGMELQRLMQGGNA